MNQHCFVSNVSTRCCGIWSLASPSRYDGFESYWWTFKNSILTDPIIGTNEHLSVDAGE